MWLKLSIIVVASVVLIVVSAVWMAQQRWRAATSELREQLFVRAAPPATAGFSASELDGLPPPVARYLRSVLRNEQPVPRSVHVSWVGEFNLGKPGEDKWIPFTAEQDFVPSAPGFVWDAQMKMAGLPIDVRDAYLGGAGSMRGKLLGLVTVVDREGGGTFAVAALQRYLGETIWLPTALLPSQGVRWAPIDDRRARATVRDGDVSATLEFGFGADGLVETVYAAERIFDDGKSPPRSLPWRARVLDYGEVDGFKVPREATVEWLMPEGPYAYWRGRPTHIAYDAAPPSSGTPR